MNNELSIEIKTYAQEATNQLNKLKQTLKQLSGDVDTNQKKIQNTTSTLSKALNVTGVIAIVKQISRKFMDSINAVNGYSEALNLFNVVMGNTDDKFSELGLSATKFQNKMREAFGLQQTQTLTYQALYQSMAENMGIVSDKASIMSENTTKLINDLSSLYNRDEKTTAEALRAGIYAGQTKPLRSFGIDVTQTSLTPILEDLGIERTVNQLNQAERQILRYIAVLKQSSIAHGDWANTIESPSNQLRIFKNQLAETSVAIGSLFQGAFAKILPYANAILMVIKEVTNAIATMFGIEIEDYNSAIASPDTDVSGYYDDIADSVGGATKAVKQLKRETLSFDQIHNINENNDTGSSGGIGVASGGIDQRLLDAINGYDNGLDKVKMKATEIRDKIMDWLGFTKVIDPLTGKISWKYEGLKTTLKNIWNWFKNLSPLAKTVTVFLTTIAGNKILNGFKKLFNAGKNLVSIFGNSGLGKALKSLLTPTKNLLTSFKNFPLAFKGYGSIKNAFTDVIESWRVQQGIIDKTTGKVDGFKGVMNGLKSFMGGLTINVAGITTLKTSLEDANTSGWNLLNGIGTVAGGISTIIGGVQMGAVFGPWGAAIGGVIGAFETLYVVMDNMPAENAKLVKEIEEHKKVVDEAYQSYINFRDGINDSFKQTDAEFGYYERLKDELDNIINANGTIKQGYEDRASAIVNELNEALGLHIQIVNGHIDGWNGVSDAIDKAIEKEKAYAKLEVLKSSAQNAYGEIEEATEKVTQATNTYNDAISKLQEQLDKKAGQFFSDAATKLGILKNKYGITTEELTEYYATGKKADSIQNALNNDYEQTSFILDKIRGYVNKNIEAVKSSNDTLQTANETLEGYNNTIKDWEYGTELATQGNYEALNQFFDYDRNIRGKNLEEQANYWNEVKQNAQSSLEYMNSNQETYDEKSYNSLKDKYEKEIALADKSLAEINDKTLNSLIEQSQTIENLTPEIRDKWQKLANDNHDVYMEQMSKLPVETRLELLDVKSLAEGDLSNELVNAFGNLATENKDKFIEKISPMPEETKSALSQKMQSAGYEVGDLFSTNVNDAGDNIDLQTPIGNELDKTSTSTKSGGLWEKIKSIGSNIWSGITTTLNQSATLGSGLQGFGANVLNSVKNMLGIHSPSKLMINAKVGNFLFDGILEGMEEEIPKMKNVTNEMISDIKGIALNGMNELNYDLASLPSMENNINKVNSVNDNYYANLSASLIEQATYRGIARAISDYGLVQIDVNSKVEKGVITDVAVDGIKDYIRRTGSNPFDEVL